MIDMNNAEKEPDCGTAITYEKVREAHEISPKRFCMKTTHPNALTDKYCSGTPYRMFFNIPFGESIRPVFEKETGLSFEKSQYGLRVPLCTEEQCSSAAHFKEKYLERVFLRDTLDLSMALSMNSENGCSKTGIGDLEYQAKYGKSHGAVCCLARIIGKFIRETPFYRDVPFICAVPSSDPSEKNLPNKIACILERDSHLKNISSYLCWNKGKGSLKNLEFEKKWKMLDKVGLNVSSDIKGKDVILLDDLYQSGTTIQFVAMKMKEAGARKIYGLAIVKSMSDSDNT